jgi:hypothetical protein
MVKVTLFGPGVAKRIPVGFSRLEVEGVAEVPKSQK